MDCHHSITELPECNRGQHLQREEKCCHCLIASEIKLHVITNQPDQVYSYRSNR